MPERRLRVVGIGAGHPDQLTVEAVQALRTVDYALAPSKRSGDPLVAARELLVSRHAPGLELVTVDDPERDRSVAATESDADYAHVVGDWHDARAAAFEQVLRERPGDVALLVWGDPAFYDSTIRVVRKFLDRGVVTFDGDVVPGISALQLLAARHRIVLHEVGQPLLITTQRRLDDAVASGADNVLVMLTREVPLAGLDDWFLWWGANLGTPSERLVSGRVADVRTEVVEARRAAKGQSGWVMDVHLLQRSTERSHK